MRACLAAKGPAFVEDVDITHATAHPDVLPTIFAALGLPRPAHVEGRPILAALTASVASATVVGRKAVGDVFEKVFEAERVLDDGSVFSQKMIVGYEEGGPLAGRLVVASFDHEKKAVLVTNPDHVGESAAKL